MALIPPAYLDAVVSLGTKSSSFEHHGTGFLYAHALPMKSPEQTYYQAFLVTNRHVVDTGITHVRFNHLDTGWMVRPVDAVTTGAWTSLENGADVAVTPVPDASLLRVGRELGDAGMFLDDIGAGLTERVEPMEGDGVFLIGFPRRLVDDARNYPVVRYGVVARIQDWLRRDQDTFLIDAPAFPGNSGGPIVLEPNTVAIEGTKAHTHCLLVGVVSERLRSRERAISERTGEPRIVFTENLGLARVVPMEFVRDTATQAISALLTQ